jgi:ACS family pantothenate transporter-like MFS transporter
MFSGYLQAAAYTNLNGVGGMAGWRWLFIIDGVITVPIALVGFFVFPGVPESPRPFYISEEEIALGKRRMADYNAKPAGKLNLAVLRRTFGRWHWYIFVLAYM